MATRSRFRRPKVVIPRSAAHTRRSGFTLIELLVCLGIVALLISLVIPGLRMARDSARQTLSLSNLRQHGGVFGMYSADWVDCFPFFAQPVGETIIRCEVRPRVRTIPFYHFSHANWNYALADRYYNGEWDSKAFYGPGFPAGYDEVTGFGGPSTYWYGCTFIARPEFWNPSTRTGIEQRRSTRSGEVLFPSHKVLLFSTYPLHFRLGPNSEASPTLATECQFVDGSAVVRISEFLPGYPNGDGPYPGSGEVHPFDWYWTLHTIDGVRGRDVPSR